MCNEHEAENNFSDFTVTKVKQRTTLCNECEAENNFRPFFVRIEQKVVLCLVFVAGSPRKLFSASYSLQALPGSCSLPRVCCTLMSYRMKSLRELRLCKQHAAHQILIHRATNTFQIMIDRDSRQPALFVKLPQSLLIRVIRYPPGFLFCEDSRISLLYL